MGPLRLFEFDIDLYIGIGSVWGSVPRSEREYC